MSTYCGPYVLSHVLGITREEAAKLIQDLRARRERVNSNLRNYKPGRGYGGRRRRPSAPVTSVWSEEIAAILEARHRVLSNQFCRQGGGSPTLRQWLAIEKVSPFGCYVLLITGHFIVYDNGHIFDNTHPEGVEPESGLYARRRVKRVWEVRRAV